MNKITVGSFFAGVGGIDLGFEMSNKFNVVYSNEIDKYPIKTYEENFNLKVDNRDIKFVHGNEIPDFDVMVGGFPCQAFSLAGYRQGFDDHKGRGTLFFEMIRIIDEKRAIGCQPKVIFLENVKNLVSHDKGNTFKVILNELKSLGYYVKYQVLNSAEYGNIPQNRERIYIVGFLSKDEYTKFKFPEPIELTTKLKDVIDFKNIQDSKYYYSSKNFKNFDILKEEVIKEDTVYQWRRVYIRENKNNMCPTLTANMGTGGHNVPIIKTKYGIRKLTPKECFRLQGFPDNFKLPSDLSNTRLYKQAGNSVCVMVIKRIADNVFGAMNNI